MPEAATLEPTAMGGGIESLTQMKFAERPEASLHVSFLHIDCDLYSSTKTVLSRLAAAIHCGTVIVFDEYCGYDGWEQHEARAWSEFCSEFDVEFEWVEEPTKTRKKAGSVDNTAKAAGEQLLVPSGMARGDSGPSRALMVTSTRHASHGHTLNSIMSLGIPTPPTPADISPPAAIARQSTQAADLLTRLTAEASALQTFFSSAEGTPPTLLDLTSLGSARPDEASLMPGANKPFVCAVRIAVRGQTIEQAVEQGEAVVSEVREPLLSALRAHHPPACPAMHPAYRPPSMHVVGVSTHPAPPHHHFTSPHSKPLSFTPNHLALLQTLLNSASLYSPSLWSTPPPSGPLRPSPLRPTSLHSTPHPFRSTALHSTPLHSTPLPLHSTSLPSTQHHDASHPLANSPNGITPHPLLPYWRRSKKVSTAGRRPRVIVS